MQKRVKISCLLIDSSVGQEKWDKRMIFISGSFLIKLPCNCIGGSMIWLMPGGFQSPVETTISAHRSWKRRRILNSKQRGMIPNQIRYLLSKKGYRKLCKMIIIWMYFSNMLNQPSALWDNADLKSSLCSIFLGVKNNVCLSINIYPGKFSET